MLYILVASHEATQAIDVVQYMKKYFGFYYMFPWYRGINSQYPSTNQLLKENAATQAKLWIEIMSACKEDMFAARVIMPILCIHTHPKIFKNTTLHMIQVFNKTLQLTWICSRHHSKETKLGTVKVFIKKPQQYDRGSTYFIKSRSIHVRGGTHLDVALRILR